MNRYIKRIEALFICICVIFTCLPVKVNATENENVTIILGQYDDVTEKTKHIQYNVIKWQDDFCFSGEDISFLTGYDYSTNGNMAYFTRGDKTIEIDIEKGILQAPGKISAVKLESPVLSSNGLLYFSGAYLFPWLNVTCFEEAGVLYIAPDMVSVWDFINDFDQEKKKLLFDLTACCQQLDIDSKWLQVSSYVKSNLISGMFKDLVWIPFSAHTYGSYRDYYDIFEKMFEQKDSMLETFEEIVDNGKIIHASFSVIEAGKKDVDEVFSATREVLSEASDASLDIAIFLHSFYQDNREKLMWMDSVSGNRENYDYPDAMIHAVFDIETAYSNKWDGIKVNLTQKLTDILFDKLIDKVTGESIAKIILESVGLYGEFVPDWNKGISNVGYYNEVASCGINVYEKSRKCGFTDIYDIQQRRAHASLYLYASAKNWETIYDYAADKGYEELAEEYQSKVNTAYRWLGKFIASSSATVNDSFRYADGRMKEEYTEELKDIFSALHIGSIFPNFDVAELNSYLSFFRDYQLGEYSEKNPDYRMLLAFAFNYIKREAFERLIYEEGYETYDIISKLNIDEFVKMYFDITIPEQSFGEFQFQDGKFYRLAADGGDAGMPIAVLDEIEIDEDGNYNITFYNVYIYPKDYETGEVNLTAGEDYYGYSMEQIQADKFCEIEQTGECKIKWLDNRFIMLEYNLDNETTGLSQHDSFMDMLLSNTFYMPGQHDFFFYEYNFEEDGNVYIEQCNVDGTMKFGEVEYYPYTVQDTAVTIGESSIYYYNDEWGILATAIATIEDEMYGTFEFVQWLVPYNGKLSLEIFNDFSSYYFKLLGNEETSAGENIIDYLFQEVPELSVYENYVEQNSNGEATLVVYCWSEEEMKDRKGNSHNCVVIYVGEAWNDGHDSNWDYFYIDKDSKQIFWWEMMDNVIYDLEEWRQSIYYRKL